MPIKTVAIPSTPNGSRLFAEDIHTAYHLDLPIAEEDLRNLIVAAAKADDRAHFVADGLGLQGFANAQFWFCNHNCCVCAPTYQRSVAQAQRRNAALRGKGKIRQARQPLSPTPFRPDAPLRCDRPDGHRRPAAPDNQKRLRQIGFSI